MNESEKEIVVIQPHLSEPDVEVALPRLIFSGLDETQTNVTWSFASNRYGTDALVGDKPGVIIDNVNWKVVVNHQANVTLDDPIYISGKTGDEDPTPIGNGSKRNAVVKLIIKAN